MRKLMLSGQRTRPAQVPVPGSTTSPGTSSRAGMVACAPSRITQHPGSRFSVRPGMSRRGHSLDDAEERCSDDGWRLMAAASISSAEREGDHAGNDNKSDHEVLS